MSAVAAVPSTPFRPITKDPKISHAPERAKRSRVVFEAGEADEEVPNVQRKLKLKKEQPLLHPDFVSLFIGMAMGPD
jgi:hypothetical protein